MNAMYRNIISLFTVFLLLLSANSANAVTFECDFTYKGQVYEWLTVDNRFYYFDAINDSGQAVIGTRDRAVFSFLDTDTLAEQQVVAEYQFNKEYNALIELYVKGFNNSGEIFGDVFLGNDIPAGVPLGPLADFLIYSNGFAYRWDKINGLVDLSSLISGLKGRGDIGYIVGIETGVTPHEIYTRYNAPDGSQEVYTTTPFPFQLRQPQQNGISLTEVYSVIQSQCVNAPVVPGVRAEDDLPSDSNSNLEFISRNNLIRLAKPRMKVTTRHTWSASDGSRITPPRAAHLPGKVGERPQLELDITNNGAIDLKNLKVSVKTINSSTDEVLRFNGTIYEGVHYTRDATDTGLPTSFPSGDRVSQLVKIYQAVKPGDVTYEIVVTAEDPAGKVITVKRTLDISVENNSPDLTANFAFSDGRTSGLIKTNEQFGVTLTINASEGEGDITNIKFSNPFFNATNLEVVSAPNVPVDGYTLKPGASLPPLNWTLKAKSSGRWRLATDVTGVDKIDIKKTSETAILLGSVGGLEVVVTPDKTQIELKEDDDGPIPEPVMVKVEIKNPTNATITDLVLTQKKPKIVTLVARDPLADPFAYLELADPNDPGNTDMVPITGNPKPIDLPDIPAGGSFTVSFPGQAQDDGTVKLEYSITGMVEGKATTGVGAATVKVLSDILLSYKDNASGTGPAFTIEGGTTWAIEIEVKNRSAEKKLDVQLLPVTRGNATYAVPVPKTLEAPDVACPTGVRRTLEPGEVETFKALVYTSKDGGTRGEVGYQLSAWSHEVIDDGTKRTNILSLLDNDKQVLIKEGSAVVKPGTNGNFYLTHVNVQDEPKPTLSYVGWIGGFFESALVPMGQAVKGIGVLAQAGANIVIAGLKPWKYPEYFAAASVKTMTMLYDIYTYMDDTARQAWKDGVIKSLVKAGMKQEEALTAFNDAITNVFIPLQEAHLTGDSLAVAQWYGSLTGNVGSIVAGPELLAAKAVGKLSVCRLATTKAISASDDAATLSLRARLALKLSSSSKAEAAAKVAAATAKKMPNGAVLKYAEHVRDVFGVDRVTHQKLIELADKWKIVAVVRARGKGAIARLKSGRYLPKPEAIKAKNVSHIDRDWLGFKTAAAPDGLPAGVNGLVDEVAIRVPPPIDKVLAKLKDANKSAEFTEEVIVRYNKRLKEFRKELDKWEKYEKEGIPFPKDQVGVDFRDNVVGRNAWGKFADDSQVLKRQKFVIEKVKAADGETIYRPKILRSGGDGKFQYVTGDMDPMAFVKPDGRPLSITERLKLYKEFPDIGLQHPETMTWTSRSGRNEYFQEFSTHNPNAEAMLAYLPNGQQIATRFDPKKSWLNPDDIEKARWVFTGLNGVIRASEATPTDIAPRIDRKIYLSPNTTFINDPNCNVTVNKQEVGIQANDQGCTIKMDDAAGTPTLRLTDEGIIEEWVAGEGWKPYEIKSKTINMAPHTLLKVDSEPGDLTLQIRSKTELDVVPGEDEWFSVGDTVVIDPGGPNEETAIIAGFGSLIFTEPLKNAHVTGEWISMVEPARVQIDTDKDGVEDGIDAFPNDPNESVDSDLDGIGNNTDPDDDNDGISDEEELLTGSDPLDDQDTPEQHRPDKPEIYNLYSDQVKPLTHFDLDISPFTDPDETGSATAIDVIVEGSLGSGDGMIFHRRMPVSDPMTLEFPAATFDTAKDYRIKVRYIDASGQTSDESDSYTFTAETLDPDDLNANRIEDMAETAGVQDVNNNGVDDSSEGITVIQNAQNGELLGISVDKGRLNHISVMSKADIPVSSIPAVVREIPLGMIGFRVDDLQPGDEVTVTFYPVIATVGVTGWYQYDPIQGLVDISSKAVFLPDGSFQVKYVDGGTGDLDGVANGRIVDPSGPAIENTDGFCFIATAAYGDYDAPQVRILRQFRDEFLKPYAIGQRFIQWYYATSPKLSAWVADKPMVRVIVQGMLAPVVWITSVMLDPSPQKMAMLLAFLLIVGSLGYLIIMRRQKARFS